MRKLLWALMACALLLPASTFAADSLLVDNLDPGYVEISGTWFGSTYGYLDSSRWCVQDTTPDATARWTPPCSTADKYNVYYIVPSSENSSTSAKYRVNHTGGDTYIYKDQNKASGYWVFLGAYDMPGDSSGFVEAINDTAGATGWAFRADAVLWEAVGDTQDIHMVYFYHDFDIVDIGDSTEWTFDFSNVGGDTLTVSNITTYTAEFTVVAPTTFPLKVGPGNTQDVTVKFKPFSGGNYSDSVQVFSDDPDTSEWVRTCQLVGKSGVLLVDDGDPGYQEIVGTTWAASGGWDGDSRWAQRSNDPMATARWTPNVPSADTYNAFFYLPPTANSATNAKYTVVHSGGSTSQYLDQNRGSGQWIFLGQHAFSAGQTGYVEVVNDTNVVSGGYAFRADAVKLETPTETQDIYVIDWTHNFEQVSVGNTSDWVFTVHNVGALTLTVDSVVTTDPSFTIPIPAFPQTVAPGGALDITARFGPLAQGLYSESLTIYSDDPLESARSISLSGEGVGQVFIVDNEDGAPWYTEDSDTTWGTSGSSAYGANSRYSTSPKTPPVWAKWTPNITFADYYDVYWIIVNTDWTDANALYEIHSSDAMVGSYRVNQQFCTDWKFLGTYYFDTDTSGYVMVINDSLCTGPVVRADAIKFLQAKGDTTPPPAVDDLKVEKSGGDAYLSWSPVTDIYTGVAYYIVFRSTTPAFIPTSGDSIGEALTPEYLDVGAIGTDYYYVVRAVDNVDLKGDYSNQVGEVDKNLLNAK
jgi:hypothetical protein